MVRELGQDRTLTRSKGPQVQLLHPSGRDRQGPGRILRLLPVRHPQLFGLVPDGGHPVGVQGVHAVPKVRPVALQAGRIGPIPVVAHVVEALGSRSHGVPVLHGGQLGPQ